MMDVELLKENSNNREMFIEAVNEAGKYLDYASDELKDDKELVLLAIANDGGALEFASDNLKDDKEVVL